MPGVKCTAEMYRPIHHSKTKDPDSLSRYMIVKGSALIETSARKLKIEAENEANKKTAQRMLNMGKLTIEEVAMCSGLSIEEVEQLAGLQTV